MSHPWYHAHSSAKRFGGRARDYLPLHNWLDESKQGFADYRHRALRHHSEGIWWAEQVFGPTLRISTGAEVPTRLVAEQHVMEDLGWIPSLKDWLKCIQPQPWMKDRAKLVFRRAYKIKVPTILPERFPASLPSETDEDAHAKATD